MLIYLSAGEHSGDMHAASLARALQARGADLELFGMGGPLMREAGVEILIDPTRSSTIGFVEALRSFTKYRRILRKVVAILAQRRPDVVVWVDFGGFNLALARACRRLGIPVVCIFSPSAWAYGRKRAVSMAACVTELAAVLPFEADFYRSFGLRTTYVGHPLLDIVRSTVKREDFRARLGIHPQESVLALLPGSRRQEIDRLLPVMLAALSKLRSEGRPLRAVLPLAPSISRVAVAEIVSGSGQRIDLISGGAYEVLSSCDAAIIASGTATLEAALLLAPHISIYRVSTLSLLIYKALRNPAERGKRISTALPNLIAGRQVVPELLQDELTAATLAANAARILDDPAYRASIRAGLQQVRDSLGDAGVMDRVAEIVLRVASR
ncbi:MAG: lipid-A-disaccharide synthase [Bacteroidota bacterium]